MKLSSNNLSPCLLCRSSDKLDFKIKTNFFGAMKASIYCRSCDTKYVLTCMMGDLTEMDVAKIAKDKWNSRYADKQLNWRKGAPSAEERERYDTVAGATILVLDDEYGWRTGGFFEKTVEKCDYYIPGVKTPNRNIKHLIKWLPLPES